MNDEYPTGIDWFCPRGCQVFTPKLPYSEAPECGSCGSPMTTDDTEYYDVIESIERSGIAEIEARLAQTDRRRQVSPEESKNVNSELTELSDEQLHAEYEITQETLAYHKEQVGHVSSQLNELTVKLAQKKKERDVHVAQYDGIRSEFTRRKNTRRKTQKS